MAKISALKPGDVLWLPERVKMGNTTISHTQYIHIRVIEVDQENQRVTYCYNGNAVRKCGQTLVNKWRRTKPSE